VLRISGSGTHPALWLVLVAGVLAGPMQVSLGSAMAHVPELSWLAAPAGGAAPATADAADIQAQGWDDDDTEGAFFALTGVSAVAPPALRVLGWVLVPVPNDFTRALLRPPRAA
jgi:hypothetical protein